jgi:hypothetical protein
MLHWVLSAIWPVIIDIKVGATFNNISALTTDQSADNKTNN